MTMSPSEKACAEIIRLVIDEMSKCAATDPTYEQATVALTQLAMKVSAVATKGLVPEAAGRIDARAAAGLAIFDQAVEAERAGDMDALEALKRRSEEMLDRTRRGEL